METENDNVQPASSGSSSSSSNLLVNLPVTISTQSSNNGVEAEREGNAALSSPSSISLIGTQNVAHEQPVTTAEQQSMADSQFQFNNNSTPPHSSSSHNHPLHQHSTLHQNRRHFPHYRQQQSPPPSPTQPVPNERATTVHQEEFSINAEDIAESIDASTIESDLEREDLNSTLHQNTTQATVATRASSYSSPVLPLTSSSDEFKRQPIPNTDQFHYNAEPGKFCTMMFNSDKTGEAHSSKNQQATDRLKLLYPNVNEDETPLPRCWSSHDKCLAIGLSNNNLRVRYKGAGKQHNEAASVRTAHPIPAACGLYYFEVKIISKGKNGYMGIGLTAQQFRMNRLPGWDKQSYGYHGDDGNSFSSSGNGQSYGPTFTTGDIIGCCVNFKHNLCFYTKNGIHLGTAFRDLPSKLYPTVGLQTPGEEVDANFGQEPFKFDQIEDLMKQMRTETISYINDFPLPAELQTPMGDPTALLNKWVSSYLVHNGYSSTAEAFARTTGQTLSEDVTSIKNRQKIMKLVMAGKISQAIEHTIDSYPGVLENNKNLLFMLKCRQFIEMVNGCDVEYCSDKSITNTANAPIHSSTQTTPPNQTSVIQSTKSYHNGNTSSPTTNKAMDNIMNQPTVITEDDDQPQIANLHADEVNNSDQRECPKNFQFRDDVPNYFNDVEMENGHNTNGKFCKNESSNISKNIDLDEDMDVDQCPSSSKSHCNSFERILEFGKDLSQMGQQLEKKNKMSSEDRQMLEDAFSLIAYSNPWSSPLGWQLCPSKREAVCSALNSAILESRNQPWRPPLEVCVSHASELLKVMARAWIGSGGFVNIEDIFTQN